MEKNKIHCTPSFDGIFGVSEAEINPPLEIYFRNWGASSWDKALGFHKPLKMQCLLIGDTSGEAPLAIVTADLGWWINAADEIKIRKYVLEHFHMAESQLLFCLSHTHAGPSICSNDIHKPGGEHIKPYLDFLGDTMVELVQNAYDRLEVGSMQWEYGHCDLAQNRDLRQEDGSFLVGYNPVDKADDTLLLIHVRKQSGQAIATVINYACHPTTLAHENRLISPDYIGALRETVSSRTDAPCLFLQGASGELAPMVQYVADTSVVDAHGRNLAYAALSVYEGLLPPFKNWSFVGALPSGAPLAIWKYTDAIPKPRKSFQVKTVEVPLKEMPSLEEIRASWESTQDRVWKDRLWRRMNTREVVGDGTSAQVKVWIWLLGDGVIVAQPNETYSSFQKSLRQAFPTLRIAVVNIANGYVGYMPDSALYGKSLYAFDTTPYGKGALEILTESVIAEIHNMLRS